MDPRGDQAKVGQQGGGSAGLVQQLRERDREQRGRRIQAGGERAGVEAGESWKGFGQARGRSLNTLAAAFNGVPACYRFNMSMGCSRPKHGQNSCKNLEGAGFAHVCNWYEYESKKHCLLFHSRVGSHKEGEKQHRKVNICRNIVTYSTAVRLNTESFNKT